jgi:hypothetical protein
MDGTRQPAAFTPGSELCAAARELLAADGRAFALQPWQAAYLVAISEGREGVVPPGCGVGKGWLQARLEQTLAARRTAERTDTP